MLLVPVRGPSSASGAVISRAEREPDERSTSTVAHQPSPNVIGSQPKTITENARFPPKNTAARFAGRESRSASGMYATPGLFDPARAVRDRRLVQYVIVAMTRQSTLD